MQTNTKSVHLTYCTNIHPGESWAEVKANLRTHVLEVKRTICPHEPFGLGLRLSAQAAEHLSEHQELTAFKQFLSEHNLYVFTLNGFPYGRFHGPGVKQNVYKPDWRDGARLAYSNALARILSEIMPRDVMELEGTISTVPGCFREEANIDPAAVEKMTSNLIRHAVELIRLEQKTGAVIGLALEPEPFCIWETTEELTSYFSDRLFTVASAEQVANATGLTSTKALEALRRHVGICLDACHAAVAFEDAQSCVQHLTAAGVRIMKIQITAGLQLENPTPSALKELCMFANKNYLHQTFVRSGDEIRRHLDLPDALEKEGAPAQGEPVEWRTHCHVPVFQRDLSHVSTGLQTTQDFVTDLLQLQARHTLSHHLEVETYTWNTLPAPLRNEGLTQAISRELRWAGQAIGWLGENRSENSGQG